VKFRCERALREKLGFIRSEMRNYDERSLRALTLGEEGDQGLCNVP